MTEKIFKSWMKRLPAGQYPVCSAEIFNLVCPKSYRDLSKPENLQRQFDFMTMFVKKKYAFEYMFNGKIRLVKCLDLEYLVVEE